MAEMIMPLLRTVFLPQGSPGIGAINEIKADIRNAEISAEDGKIYCVGEADLLIDYISFAGNDIKGETGYMVGSGKQWQALLSMPFELMESGNMLCTDTAMVEVADMEWFMVGSRALEMEMELKISYNDGQNSAAAAIADKDEDEPESASIIRRPRLDISIPDIRLPAWTMITIDEQDVRPVLSPAVTEKKPREGWTMVELAKPEQAKEEVIDLPEVREVIAQGVAQKDIPQGSNALSEDDTVSDDNISAQVRELVADAAAEALPTFVFDFRQGKSDAVHIAEPTQPDIIEVGQSVAHAAMSGVAHVSASLEQADDTCEIMVESAIGEPVIAAEHIADIGVDSAVAEEAVFVSADIASVTTSDAVEVAASPDKRSKTEKVISVVEAVGDTVGNIADAVVNIADAFSETVAEASAVAEIIETVADAVSGTDGGKGGLGVNAVMAAAAVLTAADILPLGADDEEEVVPAVVGNLEDINDNTPLIASEPQPRLKARKRRGATGIPSFDIKQESLTSQNVYDIAIKK